MILIVNRVVKLLYLGKVTRSFSSNGEELWYSELGLKSKVMVRLFPTAASARWVEISTCFLAAPALTIKKRVSVLTGAEVNVADWAGLE